MSVVKNGTLDQQLNERLATSGFRFTPQRQQVYDVLQEKRDHPSAEEVFLRAKHRMPEISMATVYNCLDALVTCGLVKQVNMDRGATRYCPNMHEHCHFHCDSCGGIHDIELGRDPLVPIPSGFQPKHFELSIRGLCPQCAAKQAATS